MDLLSDQLFRLSQQFCSQDANTGRSIADFVVLDLGNVDKNFRGGIVELNSLENCCTVVGDVDFTCGSGLEDFVHAFGTQGRFDEITERESTDERRETRIFGFFFSSLQGQISPDRKE